jgi:hypothetical protein
VKTILISVGSTLLAALLLFSASVAKDATLQFFDTRYILVADALFNALQKKNEEIWTEQNSSSPDAKRLQFLRRQAQELEAEMNKRSGNG